MFRIGQGFDLHRLVDGRKLILGGVEIPYDKGLDGHSDADVLIHAVIDSLIGALALGDIGKLFPDTDAKFKDADSKLLLKSVYDIVKEKGYRINNLDTTIIIQKPKLRDYIDRMRAVIADILELSIDDVSIKAKTSENVGIVGRGEAAIAESVVLLVDF